MIATAVMSELTFAGPETERFSPDQDEQLVSKDEFQPSVAVNLTDLDQLLATPRFADPTAASADPDLSRGEHPMIPLPSSLWAGLAMLLGVSVYTIRQQQRSSRVTA